MISNVPLDAHNSHSCMQLGLLRFSVKERLLVRPLIAPKVPAGSKQKTCEQRDPEQFRSRLALEGSEFLVSTYASLLTHFKLLMHNAYRLIVGGKSNWRFPASPRTHRPRAVGIVLVSHSCSSRHVTIFVV